MSYVMITRQELESWLDSIKSQSGIKGWSRVQGFQGVYLIHLSEMVAVKLSSTIGGADDAKGRGQASMNLSLVSRVFPKIVLNKKARDRKYFQRTTNWKKTWLEGVKHWISVYSEKADFYDNIARVEDRSKYTQEWIGHIESVANWASKDFLVKNHQSLTKGYLLWPNQEQRILEMLNAPSSGGQNTKQKSGRLPLDPETLRELYRRARSAGEARAMEAIKQLGLQAVSGSAPTEEQYQTFVSLSKYFGMMR